MTAQCRLYFEEQGLELVPPYLIATKDAVKEKAAPVWTRKKNVPSVTKSFSAYTEKLMLQDFASSVLQVSETCLGEEIKNASSIQPTSYEFPNGYNDSFVIDKFKLCEGLFDSSTSNLKGVHGGDLLALSLIHI